MNHETALKYIDGIIKYLEEQDDITVWQNVIKKTSITSWKEEFSNKAATTCDWFLLIIFNFKFQFIFYYKI